MLELRFGSYSIAATFAGTPTLSRRKSTLRYCFLWPPPRCHTTISPWLLRPPLRFFGSSNDFSGVCLVIWLLSRTVINRRDAVYGLKLFSPIAASYLLCCFLFVLRKLCTAGPFRFYRFSEYSIIFSPAASFTYAFFQSRRNPSFCPRRRILPTKCEVRTATTFTLKICCTASLICVFVAREATSKTTVCCSSFTPKPFSVMIGRLII